MLRPEKNGRSIKIHGGNTAQLRNIVEHDELVLENINLLLFRPALVCRSMVTLFRLLASQTRS